MNSNNPLNRVLRRLTRLALAVILIGIGMFIGCGFGDSGSNMESLNGPIRETREVA